MTVQLWFAFALVVLLGAALLTWLGAVSSRPALLALATAEGALGVVGLVGTLGHPWSLALGQLLGFETALRADPLSGLFLTITGVVAACCCLIAAGSVRGEAPPASAVALGAVLLLAVAVTVTASDVFVLILGWELVSFTFYALSGHRGTTAATRAGLSAFGFGKSSGALLLVGLCLLARGHGIRLAELADSSTSVVHGLAYALLVLGFGIKVGLVPVQVWLPASYEAAPPVLRPLMAAVAVNVGFYGLWRTIDLLGPPPEWLVITVLLVAGLTALLGVAHACVQTRLPRVIAWSSVENAGLIVVGFGIALVGERLHDERLVAVGLLTGTMQMVAHALAKALLFGSSATMETLNGSVLIDRLRGAGRRSPYSGAGFVVGCLTLAALPPTAGFVSEWFLLESLMQQFRVPGLILRLTLALTGALVALTAGFAGVAFVRLVGFVALGPRTSGTSGAADGSSAGERSDVGIVGRIGLGGLVLGCLGVAACTRWEIQWIGRGLAPVVSHQVTDQALRSGWVVQPVYAGFSALSPAWLWIVMPGLTLAVLGAATLASQGRLWRVRRVQPWLSAGPLVAAPVSYTAFGFSNPTRKVLANVLLSRSRLVELERSSGGTVGDEGRGPAGAHLGYTADVVEIVERYLYRPLRRPLKLVVRLVTGLQSGRLDAYITYMLIAVLAMLAVVVALS